MSNLIKVKDLTLKEYKIYYNLRSADGNWDIRTAMAAISFMTKLPKKKFLENKTKYNNRCEQYFQENLPLLWNLKDYPNMEIDIETGKIKIYGDEITERLTIKSGNTYKYNFNINCDFEERDERSIETHNKIVDKLGKLEDIEDELGIDLITLFNALKNGVYVISYDEGIVFEGPMLCFNQERDTKLYVFDSIHHIPPDELCKSIYYRFKDYGKTWALTKEELK